jgi:hypothetical protein
VSNQNLLQETLKAMEAHGKSPLDVRWTGTRDGSVVSSWDTFANIAKDANYDAGFGGAEVAESLVVVGDDWWLERHEYDGSEWWEFKRLPMKAQASTSLKRILCASWGPGPGAEKDED